MGIGERDSGRSRGVERGQERDDDHEQIEQTRADHMRLLAMRKRQVQRKATRPAGGGAKIPSSGGAPLGADIRSRMEPQLGADLSHVTVHTGSDSAAAADRFGARAFTTGSDVHFGAGEFAPGTKEGDRLIAHELTHAVQAQQSGIQRKATGGEAANEEHGAGAGEAEHGVSQPNEPAEQEADAVADGVADNLHGGGKQISRQPAGKEAAPPIGAKLSGRKIFRAGKGPLPSGAKDAMGAGPEVGAMHAGNRRETGVVRAPRHHVFPQNAKDKAWFAERGVNVDDFCIVADEGEHSAIHTMGWNARVMADLKKAEKLKGKGKLTLGEMLTVVKPLMVEFKIGGRPFVPFAGDDGGKGEK